MRKLVRKLPRHVKEKYWRKTASESGIYATFLRLLDFDPLIPEYIWLQLNLFDLMQLGLALLYDILPADFEPYAIDFRYEIPSLNELMQGIWANFTPVSYPEEYKWTVDWDAYVRENVKEEHQQDILETRQTALKYGIAAYGLSHYDPVPQREFLRATFHRLRLLRTPDITWMAAIESIVQHWRMAGVTDEHFWNRFTMLASAQTNSICLGLSPLGRARFAPMDGDYAVIPIIDAEGKLRDLRFRTLDHIQIGLILGVVPLGYGVLLPKYSIYRLPDGKRNPPIIDVAIKKAYGFRNRNALTAWAYSNYNKPIEMIDSHKSDKTAQYDVLQAQRRQIEDWVAAQIPQDEANAVRLREYQNAVLQAINWRAKRHRWGYKAWEAPAEDDFKGWWLSHWTAQGLSATTLNRLYEGMSIWLQEAREGKLRLGRAVKAARRRLALSPIPPT